MWKQQWCFHLVFLLCVGQVLMAKYFILFYFITTKCDCNPREQEENSFHGDVCSLSLSLSLSPILESDQRPRSGPGEWSHIGHICCRQTLWRLQTFVSFVNDLVFGTDPAISVRSRLETTHPRLHLTRLPALRGLGSFQHLSNKFELDQRHKNYIHFAQ